MTGYKSSFFFHAKIVFCTEHFQQFKSLQRNILPCGSAYHVYTWCFSAVGNITKSSVRRCRSLTPHCQRNVRHYPPQIFQIKTLTSSFSCRVTTGIPSKLFVWYTLQSANVKLCTFVMDSEKSRSVETSDFRAFNCCFAFWPYTVKTKSRSLF